MLELATVWVKGCHCLIMLAMVKVICNSGISDNHHSKAMSEHDSARLLCPVCLTTDTSGLIEPVTTNCGHLLCWPCVFNWVKNLNKPSCPVCRQDIINVNTVFGLGVDRRDDDANVPPRPPSGF